jgi:hypothetical protein
MRTLAFYLEMALFIAFLVGGLLALMGYWEVDDQPKPRKMDLEVEDESFYLPKSVGPDYYYV